MLDRDHPDRPVMQRSGSVFDQPGQTPALESAMTPAIGRCLRTIPPGFRPLMLAAMRQDYARPASARMTGGRVNTFGAVDPDARCLS